MESRAQFSSQMPPHTDRSEDEETSSLSDYDSEWTQVSGAEDDSDFPPLTAASERPLSRADTIEGSIDEDIWEGFIDGLHRYSSQTSDQKRSLDADATDEVPQEAYALSPTMTTHIDGDDEAPDSSFTGTLRASRARSATSSLHASVTESTSKLRLSFPDPLSSREDLDAGATTQDPSPPPSSVEDHCENFTAEDASSSFADIEPCLAPPVTEIEKESSSSAISMPDSVLCVLSLFLYGSATSSRWQIAERIMKHALVLDDSGYSVLEDGSSRSYYFDRSSLDDTICATNEQAVVVRVFDRTSISTEMELPESSEVDVYEPSVAILLLPSRLPPSLPRHKFYLPLITPSSLDFGSTAPVIPSTFSEEVTVDSAHYTWKKLDVPKEDIIILDRRRPHAILDVSALESVDPASLAEAFSVVFRKANEEEHSSESRGSVKLFTNKWYLLAFFAATLLAATVGSIRTRKDPASTPIIVNGTSKATSIDTTSLESASTSVTLMVPANHLALTTHSSTISLATINTKSSALGTLTSVGRSSGSLKMADIAREVVSAVTVSSVASTSSSKPSTCRTKARSWVDRLNLSIGEYIPRDLIVRPVDSTGIGNKKSLPSCQSADSQSSDISRGSVIKSLSLRAVQDSLAVVSSKGKTLREAAGKDMQVLQEAIDELLGALGHQMNIAKGEMKDAKSVAQSSFTFRNARAKENARRLRHAGEHFIKAAGDHLRSKGERVMNIASQVREGAGEIRQEAINSRQSRRERRRKSRLMKDEHHEMNDDSSLAREKDEGHEKKRDRNLKRRQHRRHLLQVKD